MVAVAVLFLVKAVVLAFWVTPLWDVPDETGHYAIVADLAEGKGLPLQGKSVVPPDVMADWMHGGAPESPMSNWVAQHPPLYHLLAAPLLSAARAVTRDPRWLYRAPRLLSAVSGAAALLLFWRSSRRAAIRSSRSRPPRPWASYRCTATWPRAPTTTSSSRSQRPRGSLLGPVRALGALFRRKRRRAVGVVKLSAVPVAAALWLLCVVRLRCRG